MRAPAAPLLVSQERAVTQQAPTAAEQEEADDYREMHLNYMTWCDNVLEDLTRIYMSLSEDERVDTDNYIDHIIEALQEIRRRNAEARENEEVSDG